jgi:transposase InsO family protein
MDQGSQYVSLAFGEAARIAGISRSMGSKGGADDNAVAESFFATLKKELVHRQSWPTRRELATEVLTTSKPSTTASAGIPRSGCSRLLEFENRTPSRHGAGFAASRLRYSHDQMINS